MMRALLALGLIAAGACAPGPVRGTVPRGSAHERIATTIRVQVREGGALVVRDVPLEDYVTATVLSEIHPDIADEHIAERLFEVQAVIARTYAIANAGRHAREGFDLCSTTHCQLYEPARLRTSRWAATAHDAVARTQGEILWFGDAPARAVFHADCGGHTSDAAAVWGGTGAEYLVGAPDVCPPPHAEWTFETGTTALRAALDADARTAVGSRLDRIEVAGRDAAGRAEMLTLRGTRVFVVRGEVFRDVVTRAFGARSIRSTLFTVKKTREGFAFSGKGFGHGVGLCQAGALTRLRAGASPQEVFAKYFPGTALRR
jgi:stage II sporulation protein D